MNGSGKMLDAAMTHDDHVSLRAGFVIRRRDFVDTIRQVFFIRAELDNAHRQRFGILQGQRAEEECPRLFKLPQRVARRTLAGSRIYFEVRRLNANPMWLSTHGMRGEGDPN